MTVFFTNPPQAYAKKSWQGSAAGSIQLASMPVCARDSGGEAAAGGVTAVVTGGSGEGAGPAAAQAASSGMAKRTGVRRMAPRR